MDGAPSVAQAYGQFERARAAYMDAAAACRQSLPPRAIPLEVTRQLFRCSALVCACYCHPSNWPDGPQVAPLEPFPPVLARICADFACYLAAGKLPGPISDALARGAPKTGPEEARDQGWAVAYLLAANEGIIADVKATATVAEAFGVEGRTVRRWKKKLAASGMSWRDMVPDTVSETERDKLISDHMRVAGERYLKQGRLATPRRR